MRKIFRILKKMYQFYEVNLAFLLLMFGFNALIVGIAAAVPYLNWFLDVLPLVLLAVDWLIYLIRFRPGGRVIFIIFLSVLFVMFIMKLVAYEHLQKILGIALFGLIVTLTAKGLFSLKNEQEQ